MANHTTEAKLRELAAKGMSSKEIADELGLCHAMLRDALCILGISTRGNHTEPRRAVRPQVQPAEARPAAAVGELDRVRHATQSLSFARF